MGTLSRIRTRGFSRRPTQGESRECRAVPSGTTHVRGWLSTSVMDPGRVGEKRDQEKVDDKVKQPGA